MSEVPLLRIHRRAYMCRHRGEHDVCNCARRLNQRAASQREYHVGHGHGLFGVSGLRNPALRLPLTQSMRAHQFGEPGPVPAPNLTDLHRTPSMST